MQAYQSIWRYMRQHRTLSIVMGHVCVLLVLITLFFGSSLGASIRGAFAQSGCSNGDQAYLVQSGDTLGGIAARYNTSEQSLASYNHIANPDLIYVSETVCIPGKGTRDDGYSAGQQATGGTGNYFPYGSCTWWANNRYHQLFGKYVPWRIQSDAFQWTARAYQFGWKVSNQPSYGAILDLQPWVQGAYSLGHVAVVEKVLSNGHVIASSMNWGANPSEVTDFEFVPASGVTFITF